MDTIRTNASLKAHLTAGDGTQVIKEVEKDYNNLINKPKINDKELVGSLTTEDLGLAYESEALTNTEIEALIQGLQL